MGKNVEELVNGQEMSTTMRKEFIDAVLRGTGYDREGLMKLIKSLEKEAVEEKERFLEAFTMRVEEFRNARKSGNI